MTHIRPAQNRGCELAGETPKERPLLMSGPLVRATFADLKTNTRRVIKLPRHFNISEYPREGCGLDSVGLNADGFLDLQVQTAVDDCEVHLFPCPYGRVGDRLWVRETWYHGDAWYPDSPGMAWKNCRRDRVQADSGLTLRVTKREE